MTSSVGRGTAVTQPKGLPLKRKLLVLGALGALLAILVPAALATAPPGPVASFLVRGDAGRVDAFNQGVDVERERGNVSHAVAALTFQQGSSTGWHSHPGVVLVTVQSGALQLFDRKCRKEVVEVGESFEEEGGTHLARNVRTKDAVVYVTFIVPRNTPADGLSIPEQAPRGCDVI
jgi:quercetin dioxygenase-like cupin family protein